MSSVFHAAHRLSFHESFLVFPLPSRATSNGKYSTTLPISINNFSFLFFLSLSWFLNPSRSVVVPDILETNFESILGVILEEKKLPISLQPSPTLTPIYNTNTKEIHTF